ncbi:DUF3613 domain-containing protein [Achromobacter aloeverae]|uniref:DUF3613 domain-containing protein n=2 Tax=Achromobacter aloeverae TaxID=1750518 RepID=A0A4Q1HVC1_9BURK|nr:DUF3613 domain-containing protein [Achromobacter aloeverae]
MATPGAASTATSPPIRPAPSASTTTSIPTAITTSIPTASTTTVPAAPTSAVPIAPTPAVADTGAPARPVVRQVNAPTAGVGSASPSAAAATTTAAPRPAAAASAPDDEGPVAAGGITRALLAAQADGRRAAPLQPMLGPVATASWQRYLNSFNQPIPQWFRERVENSGGSSSQ